LLGLGFLFPLSSWERLLLFFAVAFLLFAEFVNTALELSVDLASPAYHPLAKGAKDVSAAAAFFAAVMVIVTAYGTLFPFLAPSLQQVIEWAKQLPPVVPLLIFVLAGLLAVVFARLQGGAPFTGGVGGGRAALTFTLGTLLTLVTESPQVMFLSYGLVALITPWPQDPHRRLQVLLGGVAGVSGSVLVFQAFRWLARTMH
jgi:diacylglycerol kinase (ATP)